MDKDITELLLDKEFRTKYRKKLGFIFADIPFGYFSEDPADVPWKQATVNLFATSTMDLATPTSTLLIKMGDRDYDMWRTTLEQAGWSVERDRRVLLQTPPWMQRKAYTSFADCVNAVHFWLIVHVDKRDYYLSQKPFGRACFGFFSFIFLSFCFLFFTHTSHTHTVTHTHTHAHRYSQDRPISKVLQPLRQLSSGPKPIQAANQGWHHRADPRNEHL